MFPCTTNLAEKKRLKYLYVMYDARLSCNYHLAPLLLEAVKLYVKS